MQTLPIPASQVYRGLCRQVILLQVGKPGRSPLSFPSVLQSAVGVCFHSVAVNIYSESHCLAIKGFTLSFCFYEVTDLNKE